MMCNCMAMARDFSERNDEEFTGIPASIHHPKCEDYHLIKFVSVECGGTSIVMDEGDALDCIEDSDEPEQYECEDIYLTQDQFDNMTESSGW